MLLCYTMYIKQNAQYYSFLFLLAHLTQWRHVSYCRHFASVVVVGKLLTFQSSPPKLHGPLERNLSWIFIMWNFAKFEFLLLIRNQTWLSWSIICSSQKSLFRCNYDIVEMSIRWPCTRFELLVLNKKPRWQCLE